MILVYLPKLSLDAFLEKSNFLLGVVFICGSILITILWAYVEKRIAVIQSLNVTNIAIEMRNKIYEKINKNNLLAYEDNQQYDALLKALNYTNVGADEIVSILSRFLTCVLTIIGVSYVIGEISPIMVIIIIASLILAHLCMKKVNSLLFEYQNNERLPKIRLVNYLAGLFNNKDYVTEIKLNNAFSFAIDILNSKRVHIAKESAEKDLHRFKWNFFAIFINNFQLLLSHIYFGYLLFSKTINIATYSTLFAAVQQFSSNFGKLLGIITELENKVNEASFYMSYLDDDTYEQEGTIDVKSIKNIEFKNVNFNYPNQPASVINDLSITINAGEKVAIVGENGSGKTTFLKMLLGMYPPTKGHILVNNSIDIQDINLSSWYNQISAVMQNTVHLPISIKENIALNHDINKQQLNDSIIFSGLESKIKSLNKKESTIFSTRFDKDGVDFSGGEKQKLSIARAFYKLGNVLVFDEPSSALDPNAEHEFFQKIYDLGRSKTIIFVSHRLSTVVRADKILVFKNGTVVECGTHHQLMKKNGTYAEMYNKQISNYWVNDK